MGEISTHFVKREGEMGQRGVWERKGTKQYKTLDDPDHYFLITAV